MVEWFGPYQSWHTDVSRVKVAGLSRTHSLYIYPTLFNLPISSYFYIDKLLPFFLLKIS